MGGKDPEQSGRRGSSGNSSVSSGVVELRNLRDSGPGKLPFKSPVGDSAVALHYGEREVKSQKRTG